MSDNKLELIAKINFDHNINHMYIDLIYKSSSDEFIFLVKLKNKNMYKLRLLLKEFPLNRRMGCFYIYKNNESYYILNCFNKYKSLKELVENYDEKKYIKSCEPGCSENNEEFLDDEKDINKFKNAIHYIRALKKSAMVQVMKEFPDCDIYSDVKTETDLRYLLEKHMQSIDKDLYAKHLYSFR